MALSGLQFAARVGGTAKSPIDRYTYPHQDSDVSTGDTLNLPDGTPFGKVDAIDRVARLIDVKKRGDEVPQYVKGPLPPVGQDVLGSVDWERRYQLMRTHSALHVLCGVIWRDYKMHVTSASMKPLVGRLDFVPNIPK